PAPAAAQAGRRIAVDARQFEEEIGCRGDERTSVKLLAPPDAPHDRPPRLVAPCEEPARDVVARGVIIRRVDRPLRLAAAQVEPDAGVIVALFGGWDGAPPVDAAQAVETLEPARRGGQATHEPAQPLMWDRAERDPAPHPRQTRDRSRPRESEEPAVGEAAVQVHDPVAGAAAAVVRHDG